jgi:hypothetical protein
MTRQEFSEYLYGVGGGGHRAINAVSFAVRDGKMPRLADMQGASKQLEIFLKLPHGMRMSTPTAPPVDHEKLIYCIGRLEGLISMLGQ